MRRSERVIEEARRRLWWEKINLLLLGMVVGCMVGIAIGRAM